MFKKLLNVGKGHSATDKLQQQQQRDLFQLNEIRSYGFSHLCCLGYSPSLSLLAVGSKFGLLRVLGNSSVEFSYQLESGNSIRQIEFVDCRAGSASCSPACNTRQGRKQAAVAAAAAAAAAASASNDSVQAASSLIPSAKLVVLTDNGKLHLLELKTCKPQNYADNTTQTDTTVDCCQQQHQPPQQQTGQTQDREFQQAQQTPEYTRLEYVGHIDYFRHKLDHEDRSRRVTTIEIAADGQAVFVGTEGGDVYVVALAKFGHELEDDQKKKVQQQQQHQQQQPQQAEQVQQRSPTDEPSAKSNGQMEGIKEDRKTPDGVGEDETTVLNLNDEPQIAGEEVVAADEPFEMIKFDDHIVGQLGEDVKSKKQGAVESVRRHPVKANVLLLSYHRGLSILYDLASKSVDKYFYHNQVLECSCFADLSGDSFYTSHNDGSYIKWDVRQGSQAKANVDFLGQVYGPYPCKPTPKIQACAGLLGEHQLEDLVVFSGGMPRATYDDKNPVTIVRAEPDGKDTIKTVLDFTSKVLDFVVITKPRSSLGKSATSGTGGASNPSSGGGKKNKKNQLQKQQELRNSHIAVALAILAEEEFVLIDLLSQDYPEFALPYLNCVHSSAITCNQHYSDISDQLYAQLLAHNKQQLASKLSQNEWPITGGKVIEAPELSSHDILLTGHEDGSVNFWDVSGLSMRHLLQLTSARFFSTSDDDLVPIEDNSKQTTHLDTNGKSNSGATATDDHDNEEVSSKQQQSQDSSSAWPPLKRVGRFDPYSDDTRLAVRKVSLCASSGTLVVAGTGGQVLVFELSDKPKLLDSLVAHEVTIVNDQRFAWKGREKLEVRAGQHKQDAGYQLVSFVQLNPPVSPSALDLRSDWRLYALGTSYGFLLYNYASRQALVNRCTLNVQDFAIVSGDLGATAMSRKKSFRKSLRESFRRLRRGRSQRATAQATTGVQQVLGAASEQPAPRSTGVRSLATTGVRTLSPSGGGGVNVDAPAAGRNVYSAERQVEQKVELSSIVKCVTLTSAIITSSAQFTPTLWVGTNAGQVLVYAISLADEPSTAVQEQSSSGDQSEAPTSSASSSAATVAQASARLAKEIQLKHRAPIIAIFTSPEAPASSPGAQLERSGSSLESSAKCTPEKRPSELLEASNLPDQQPAGADQSASERSSTPAPTEQQPASVQRPSPAKQAGQASQPRVLICSEEQFKVFNLPNLKPFCKFKLTAHEGLRAKKISITQFLRPQAPATSPSSKQTQQQQQQLAASKSLQSFATQTSPPASPIPPASEPDAAGEQTANSSAKQTANSESNNNSPSTLNNNHHTGAAGSKHDSKELMNAKFGAKSNSTSQVTASAGDDEQAAHANSSGAANSLFEPYMVCMSNQGDCAIYSVPDLKRQAQIQVCKREDVNGITSAMLTNYGEGFYLKSSSNFLRFSISTQRVLRVLSVV